LPIEQSVDEVKIINNIEAICAVKKPDGIAYPIDFLKKVTGFYKTKTLKTKICNHDSEKSLLGWFWAMLGKYDPDILLGHYLSSRIIDYLINKSINLKIQGWSRIGKIKRNTY
jgi:DNA polymerase alpha subunit A